MFTYYLCIYGHILQTYVWHRCNVYLPNRIYIIQSNLTGPKSNLIRPIGLSNLISSRFILFWPILSYPIISIPSIHPSSRDSKVHAAGAGSFTLGHSRRAALQGKSELPQLPWQDFKHPKLVKWWISAIIKGFHCKDLSVMLLNKWLISAEFSSWDKQGKSMFYWGKQTYLLSRMNHQACLWMLHVYMYNVHMYMYTL